MASRHHADQASGGDRDSLDNRIVNLRDRRDAGPLAKEEVVTHIALRQGIAVESAGGALLLQALQCLRDQPGAKAWRGAEAEGGRVAPGNRVDDIGQYFRLLMNMLDLGKNEFGLLRRDQPAGD